jgi:hypothetical protein
LQETHQQMLVAHQAFENSIITGFQDFMRHGRLSGK